MRTFFTVASLLLPTFLQANPATPNEAILLKKQIIDLARENNGRFDNLTEVRAQLQPLVEQLIGGSIEEFSRGPAEMDLLDLEGAWKEIWADDQEPQAPGLTVDRDATYQVVTQEGYFYNVSQINSPAGFAFTGFLRGKYEADGDYLNIEFTKISGRATELGKDQLLIDLVQGVESGEIETVERPVGGPGPVGQQGRIRNLYLDNELRIAYGRNFADEIDDLYILVRSPIPTRLK